MSTDIITPHGPTVNGPRSKPEGNADAVEHLDLSVSTHEADAAPDSHLVGLDGDLDLSHEHPPEQLSLEDDGNTYGFDAWTQDYLKVRAVPLGFAKEQGFRTVTKEEAVKLGFPASIPSGGFLQTYALHCLGDGVEQYRIQFSCPREDLNGYPKCLTLKGIRTLTWFPTILIGEVYRKDTSKPIFIAESPGKAAALTNAGFPCIGLAGVMAGWHLKGDSGKPFPRDEVDRLGESTSLFNLGRKPSKQPGCGVC